MIIVDSILETIADRLDDEIESYFVKIPLAIIFVLFYLFIVAGIISIGFGFIDKNIFLGAIFLLLGIVIFVFFLVKFIIVYSKKLNKKLSKLTKILKIFKIEKK